MAHKKISHDSRAIVTGAGSGIGRGFALELAKRNAQVVCSDINLVAAEETVALIEAKGGKALAVQCDVAQLAEVESLAKTAEQWFGVPNLVVNNAGVGVGGYPIGEVSIEDWKWTLDINLWGVIHGCHVFVPKLKGQKNAGIINVSSAASFGSAPLMGPYSASKAAVLSITETLYAELAGTDVHVTALCPTYLNTRILENSRTPAKTSELARKLMAMSGLEPAREARDTLKARDRNQLYDMPQIDAKLGWRMKRMLPTFFHRSASWIDRFAN